MADDRKSQLVDFIIHRALYPVLMADRAGPDRGRIEQLQRIARAEIERLRSFDSLEDVVRYLTHDPESNCTQAAMSEPTQLRRRLSHDLRDDVEQKARELGLEPMTLLTSFRAS